MAKMTQQQLETHLWGAAKILRGKNAGQDYQTCILLETFSRRTRWRCTWKTLASVSLPDAEFHCKARDEKFRRQPMSLEQFSDRSRDTEGIFRGQSPGQTPAGTS